MESKKKVSLRQALPVLEKTYQSIDIRAILALSRAEKFTWRIAFLKIRLTNQSIEDLKKIYSEKIKNLSSINYDDFKVLSECRKIEELSSTFDEVQNMRIKISGTEAIPLGANYQNIYSSDSYLEKDSGLYITNIEKNGYDHWEFKSVGKYPTEVLNHCKIDLSNYYIDLNEINPHLDTLSLSNNYDLIISLPIYCKRIKIPFENKNLGIANYEIHRELAQNSKVVVKLLKYGTIVEIKFMMLLNY